MRNQSIPGLPSSRGRPGVEARLSIAARRLPKSWSWESRLSIGGLRREAILFQASSAASCYERIVATTEQTTSFLDKSCDSVGCTCAQVSTLSSIVKFLSINFFHQ